MRDRWFESCSLHRRVWYEPDILRLGGRGSEASLSAPPSRLEPVQLVIEFRSRRRIAVRQIGLRSDLHGHALQGLNAVSFGFSCDGTSARRKIALAGPGTQRMPVN